MKESEIPKGIRIVDLERRAVARRDSIGIPGLDVFLGGGMLPASSLLILGGESSGKRIFGMQFLLQSLAQGGDALFVYLGTRPERIEEQLPFREEISRHHQSGRFRVVHQDFTNQLNQKQREFYHGLAAARRGRVVLHVDVPADQMTDTQRRFTADLVGQFQSAGAATLVSNPYLPSSFDNLGPARELCPGTEGVFLLRFRDGGQQFQRDLVVLNYLGLPQAQAVHRLELGEQGFSLKASPDTGSTPPENHMLIAPPTFWTRDVEKCYRDLVRPITRRFSSAVRPGRLVDKTMSFYDTLTELTAPSTQYGIFHIYEGVIPYLAREKLILPVADTVFQDVETRFLSAGLKRGMVNGQAYSIPFRTAVRILYWRKDLLNKYKLTPPRTWSEMETTIRKIQAGENNPRLKGIAFQFTAETQFSHTLDQVWSQGQDLYEDPGRGSLNKEGLKTSLARLKRWVDDESMTGRASLNWGYTDPMTEFFEGRYVFMHFWSDALELLGRMDRSKRRRFDWGVSPTEKLGQFGHSMVGGPSLVVPANTAHYHEAVKVLGAMYQAEFQTALDMQSGGTPFPALKEIYRVPMLMEKYPYYAEAEKLLANGRSVESLPFSRGNAINWEGAFSQSLEGWFNMKMGSEKELDRRVDELESRLSGFLEKPSHSPAVWRALEEMHGDLSAPLSPTAIANNLGMSAAHFSRLFRKETKSRYQQYLNKARVEKAKGLLIKGATVGEVALQVGYKNIQYFSRVFKEVTGQNPRDFKR